MGGSLFSSVGALGSSLSRHLRQSQENAWDPVVIGFGFVYIGCDEEVVVKSKQFEITFDTRLKTTLAWGGK